MNLFTLYHSINLLLFLYRANAFFSHDPDMKGITTSQLESLARLHEYNQQFHLHALAVFSSLQIPETCLHSTLTESLISKCSTSPDSIEGVEKITFATKLAVCEFKAADVQYPRECHDKLNAEWEVKRCVRKLEGRPQWWTSWSNCLQNIGVICQAVRHKADQDSLLRLHKNLTSLQTQLQTHLYDALQETELFKHDSDQYASQFSASMDNLVLEFERLKAYVYKGTVDLTSQFEANVKRSHDIAFARTEDVMQKINMIRGEMKDQYSNTKDLSDKIGQLKVGVFETFDLFKQLETSRFEDTSKHFTEAQEMLQSLTDVSRTNIESLFGISMDKLRQTKQTLDDMRMSASLSHDILQKINDDAVDLKLSQELIQHNFANVQNFQDKQFNAFIEFALVLNDTLENLIQKADKVMSLLDYAEQRIDELGNINDSSTIWFTLPLILCGVALINKRLLGHIFLLGGAFLWLWMVLRHNHTIHNMQQYLVEGSISTDVAIPSVVLFVLGRVNKYFGWPFADVIEDT